MTIVAKITIVYPVIVSEEQILRNVDKKKEYKEDKDEDKEDDDYM